MYLLQGKRQVPLGYEMNAHPASTVVDLNRAIDTFVVPVRDKVCPGEPFAIAPHIGQKLASELRKKGVAESVGDRLRDLDLHPYTVNAFPLKDFHARRVKEQVYLPSWAHTERASVTCRIADVFIRMKPQAINLSISTLGGGYRSAGNTPADHQKMALQYLKVVAHLVRLEHETGIRITLNAEPEPDTTFECAEDVIHFWENHLLSGIPELAMTLGCSRNKADKMLRRHWTVNLDACHSAVLYRSPVEDWKRLDKAGISVGKAHITSAIRCPKPEQNPEAFAELLQHIEPRYLHQSAIKMKDGSIVRLPDLSKIKKQDLSSVAEVRTHFHVPLSKARHGKLLTTRDDAKTLLSEALSRKKNPPHIAVETYTWPVLTKGLKKTEQQKKLVEGITAELRWVKKTC